MTTQRRIGRVFSVAVLVLASAGAGCSSGGQAQPSPGNGTGGAAGGLPAGGAPGSGGVAGAGGAIVASGGAGPAAGGGGGGGAPDVGGGPGWGGTPGAGGQGGKPIGPQPQPSAAEQAERDRIAAALRNVASLDSAGLATRYPISFAPKLSYDPATAQNLPLIAASTLGFNDAEKRVLGANGFVISDRQRFATFTHGYSAIYAADLPLFVSADSILYAMHRSYDSILEDLETTSLIPALTSLLTGMRASLAAGAVAPLGSDTAADIDLYLAVSLGLLSASTPAPVAGASPARISQLITEATAASGMDYVQLFGGTRPEDFSQFTPRGHYTDTLGLQQYFRAMIWLGRFDLRMIDVDDKGIQTFDRRQFNGALALATLSAAGTNQAQWQTLDTALDAFVGEPDSMKPTEFPALLRALGAADLTAVTALDDATIEAAIVAGNFGSQRIASHIVLTGIHDQALPLPRSFLVLGQRYVIDSHVFSNVTYDRVSPTAAGRLRLLPNPLDVAFSVFGANQAVGLLKSDLDTFQYAPALASMRVLADEHGDDFWNENIYNSWLGALRALGPTGGSQSGPFELAATEPWSRRLLNTQLASWAELRHDTILYVKQSYSGGPACSFPDVLVEPNPAFFDAVIAFAHKGQQAVSNLILPSSALSTSIQAYFPKLAAAATTLKTMAEAQAAGTPFTDDQMMFINQTVSIQYTCGGSIGSGWYPQLFYRSDTATDSHPTIADVHTAPADEQGNLVGWVLHVGTGYARMMVVTANTCDGPKAYVGLASSYFEDLTTGLKRLDDAAWSDILKNGAPSNAPWISDLIPK